MSAAITIPREPLDLFALGLDARRVRRVSVEAWTDQVEWKALLRATDGSLAVTIGGTDVGFVAGRFTIDLADLSWLLDCVPIADASVLLTIDTTSVRLTSATTDVTLQTSGNVEE